jgi:diadenosine tetraphosphate (Ap4A) HIT family hydrolase
MIKTPTRRHYSRDDLRYETDLTDAEWALIAPLIFTSLFEYPLVLVLALAVEHREAVVAALAEHLDELPSSVLGAFVNEAAQAGAAIRAATGADRINYAVLGNTEPHVHFHLIPRQVATDPVPTRPPWEHPLPPQALGEERTSELITTIEAALRKVARM